MDAQAAPELTEAEAVAQATAEAVQAATELDELELELARQDVNAFIEYVMRDEETGVPLTQAPFHVVWHDILDKQTRTIIMSFPESGKSQQLSIGRTLFELGRDPTLRFVIFAKTQPLAVKLVRSIASYIHHSAELHRVFPDLRILGDTDGSGGQITVARPPHIKDPSVQGFGKGGTWQGARVDRAIIDDVLDYDNTKTPSQRDETVQWFKAKVLSRMTARGRVLLVGNVFHPDDLLHVLAREWDGCAYRFPVLEDGTMRPRWPERFPLQRINAKRAELGPLEFARQMLCVPRDDATARFKREWIDVALRRGRDRCVVHTLREWMDLAYRRGQQLAGFKTYTGVDLAVQRHSAADLTVFFTILLHSNADREVLEIRSGRFSGPEIVRELMDTSQRFGSIMIVENNAAQDYIVQFGGMAGVPVIGYTTGASKSSPEFGVEHLAAEMAAGKWIVPSFGEQLHSEVEAWVQEMLFYDPCAHTGDRLMAAFFAKEGARLGLGVPQIAESGMVNWGVR